MRLFLIDYTHDYRSYGGFDLVFLTAVFVCLTAVFVSRFIDRRSKKEYVARTALLLEVEPGSYKVLIFGHWSQQSDTGVNSRTLESIVGHLSQQSDTGVNSRTLESIVGHWSLKLNTVVNVRTQKSIFGHLSQQLDT